MPKQRGNVNEIVNRQERRVKTPGTNGGPVSWTKVDPIAIAETIEVVAIAGGALRFGYTRDGGALSIGVYGDGSPYTLYVSPHEDARDLLRSIRDGFAPQPDQNGHKPF